MCKPATTIAVHLMDTVQHIPINAITTTIQPIQQQPLQQLHQLVR
jgi:hypothetical protein